MSRPSRPPARSSRASGRRLAVRAGALAAGLLALPLPVAAHALQGRVESPLPLAAYLLGAAVAVALSFAFVAISGDVPEDAKDGRLRTLPRPLRGGLRALGLLAWTWVVAQAVIGGASEAEVASLVLWVFGWVALPIVSALLGPVWPWLDPFSTLYDLAAGLARRLGIRPGTGRPLPAGVGAWPAVGFMVFFVWLELGARVDAGRTLGIVLIGYTFVTLAGMTWFGRDRWRGQGEVFGVWLATLGRLAPYGLEGASGEGRIRRRGVGSALAREPWSRALLALVAVGMGSVIYDGLSQTEPFFALFGVPGLGAESIILGLFLAAVAGLVLAVARRVGLAAMGAGLVPVTIGYLIAHYLTFLLVDGQRIAVALSDPFQQGWDLVGTSYWEPRDDWLSTSVVWSIQVGAVVIGHVAGAWMGHGAIRREQDEGRTVSQWPLALLMIGLTTLTLWSLGQNLSFEEPGPAAGVEPGAQRDPLPSGVTGRG
jgi:hypothetical protein